MRATPTITSASFTVNSGSGGTVGIAGGRFVGSQGTLAVAVWNTVNNWSTGAWVAISGVISAEL